MSERPSPDRAMIKRAARLLMAPGGVTELRALGVSRPNYRAPHTESGYYDDMAKLAQDAAGIDNAKGVYIVLNPTSPDLLARACNRIRACGKADPLTSDPDVPRRRWLPIDCDPVRPAGISASEAEHDAALARIRDICAHLKAQGWPEPVVADSGNGGHLLVPVDLPADDGGLIQRCLEALAARFSDDVVTVDTGVFNPARIWKLYGTVACKGDHTPDRPHRLAKLLSVPEQVEPVSGALLEALAAEAPEPRQPARKMDPGNGRAYDVEAFVREHFPDAKGPEDWRGQQGMGRRWEIDCPFNPDHTDGAAWITQHASGAVSAGCHHNSCSWGWADLRGVYDPKPNGSAFEDRKGGGGGGAEPSGDAKPPGTGRPEVVLPGSGTPIIDAAAQLGNLLAETGGYFARGGSVVRLTHDDDGAPVLEPVRAPALASAFETVAALRSWRITKEGPEKAPATCSETNARLILHSEAFIDQLPPVRVVTRCPVLVERSDGTLAEVAGYDRESGVLAGGEPSQDVPLAEARAMLLDLLQDFNFPTEPDRSRALAAILTPALVFGGLLHGRAPGDLGEADDSQSGKGFRNKLTGSIYSQSVTTIAQRKGGVGSLEETFNSALVRGANFIAIDNVRGKIDSPAIESFLTEDRYSARVPYAGDLEIDPRRVVLMMTSNKAEITQDLANRASCVRILKQPPGYQFQSYPEGDILDHVRRHHRRYLGAVHAIVRAWHEAGKPRSSEARHDFRGWAQVLDWIVQNVVESAPLLDGHRETQQRMTTPALTWLRDVALSVARADRLDVWLRPHDILDVLETAGQPVPGVGEDADLDDDDTRLKAMRAIGRKLRQCLANSETAEVDAYGVERTEMLDEGGRAKHSYRFFAIPPQCSLMAPQYEVPFSAKSPNHPNASRPFCEGGSTPLAIDVRGHWGIGGPSENGDSDKKQGDDEEVRL